MGGRRILVTGGTGFVGVNLCVALAEMGDELIALDHLHRRGSELNVPRLHEAVVA
jgi:nucleoside-diphosphate-sugar epimerase